MSTVERPPKAEREALEWAARLSRASVSLEDLEAFFDWRKRPRNRRAIEALMAERRNYDRFVVRPENEGFSVVDIWTAEVATIAMTPQTGMSAIDAQETANLLNRQAADGDRTIRQ